MGNHSGRAILRDQVDVLELQERIAFLELQIEKVLLPAIGSLLERVGRLEAAREVDDGQD